MRENDGHFTLAILMRLDNNLTACEKLLRSTSRHERFFSSSRHPGARRAHCWLPEPRGRARPVHSPFSHKMSSHFRLSPEA